MELVAVSKMRRAQGAVLAARPYAEKIREVIADLAVQNANHNGGALHPLLERRSEIKRVGIILITSDRGLAGGLVANITRLAAGHILSLDAPVSILAVGRKGRDWALRYGRELRAEFIGLGDRPSYLQTVPVARVAMDDYLSGYVDRVDLVFTRFISTLSQKPVIETLLPLEAPPSLQPSKAEYIYEPNAREVLADLLPRFVEVQVYAALLEAAASEQSARMVAMRNATDNANEIVRDLSLQYNQERQATITRELIDIVSGAQSGAS